MGVFSWEVFWGQISSINILDVLDILIIAVMLYFVYAFIRDRRAGKLAAGVALLIVVMLLGSLLGLRAVSLIMTSLFQVGFVALVVVFQPELRAALEKMGGEPLKGFIQKNESKESNDGVGLYITELCTAVSQLSRTKTGALIVLERSTKLGDIIKSGVTVNANMSAFVIRNIFYDGAPLHDGAVIIRDWRIYAAGCFLPLSKNDEIIKDLGTRHRAGIGMSEESDALVIIVSEETGNISVAVNGQLKRGYGYSSLKRELMGIFAKDEKNNVVGRFMPYIKGAQRPNKNKFKNKNVKQEGKNGR